MYKTLTFMAVLMLALVACGNSTTPAATSSTTTATTGSAATAVATQTDSYKALPQSQTAEGYYMLGNADAPVVMTLYSDLL